MRVVLDPNDWESMISLMDRHYEFDSVIPARNTNGEFVSISIYKDKIVSETVQHNNWVRKNVYYRDGTCEELYHKEV